MFTYIFVIVLPDPVRVRSNAGGYRKLKHFLVQPELRYWKNIAFQGSFFGAHLIYGMYNVGGCDIGSLKDYRYQGDAYGAGLSYGYRWDLSPHWKMEATAGVGYVRLDGDKYECGDCGRHLNATVTDYFGPTKIGLSLIYAFGNQAKGKAKKVQEIPVPLAPTPAPAQEPIVLPVEPAPAPVAPTPVAPVLSAGDQLAKTLPYVSKATPAEFAKITDSQSAIALFDTEATATDAPNASDINIAFPLGKNVLDPHYKNNCAELEKIKESIQKITASGDSKITGIVVMGFASPEGSTKINERLSDQRATALKKHIEDQYLTQPAPFKVFREINYAGLRKLVAASDMPSRDKVLYIIDNVPIWDANRQVGRLGELMRLDGGNPYRYMYKEFFPKLRVATYVKILYDNN